MLPGAVTEKVEISSADGIMTTLTSLMDVHALPSEYAEQMGVDPEQMKSLCGLGAHPLEVHELNVSRLCLRILTSPTASPSL